MTKRPTYEQAYDDHQYLWRTYSKADDMTGAYVDQDDLAKMLRSPTKRTARECLENQIIYWFEAGPAPSDGPPKSVREIARQDRRVLAHAPVGGWPAAEIIGAMYDDDRLRIWTCLRCGGTHTWRRAFLHGDSAKGFATKAYEVDY